MSKLKLSRRTMLRAAVSASVAVALPPLEAMFDGNGERLAYGAPQSPRRRLITYFMGNGVPTRGYCGSTCEERWIPPTEGQDFTLSQAMSTLAPVKQYVRVMSGLRNPYPGTSHCQNMSGVMTGKSVGSEDEAERRLGGATPDFIAAKTLSTDLRFKQLSLLVAGASYNAITRNTLTFDDSGAPVRPLRTPEALFKQLFTGFTPPGGTEPPDPTLVRRRAILDFVREDAKRLNDRLGAADRARLEQHLTSIESVQKSIIATSTATSTACVVPGAVSSNNDYKAMTRQMSDLIALAFACDQTRVVAFGPTGCNADVVLPWLFSTNIHDMSHVVGSGSEPNVLVNMTKYVQWLMDELAYLTQKLAGIKEGAQSILDTTLIVTTSEHGNSHNHAASELPHVVLGGPQLVKGNVHWRAPGAPVPSTGNVTGFTSNSRLWLSVLKALGVPATSFGSGETQTVPLV